MGEEPAASDLGNKAGEDASNIFMSLAFLWMAAGRSIHCIFDPSCKDAQKTGLSELCQKVAKTMVKCDGAEGCFKALMGMGFPMMI